MENINKSIKAAARTITKTKLTDKVGSSVVLECAGTNTYPKWNRSIYYGFLKLRSDPKTEIDFS